jgi:hypothetical protein
MPSSTLAGSGAAETVGATDVEAGPPATEVPPLLLLLVVPPPPTGALTTLDSENPVGAEDWLEVMPAGTTRVIATTAI